MRNYLKKITSIIVILSVLLQSAPLKVYAASNTVGGFVASDGGGSNSSSAQAVVSPFTTDSTGGTVKTGRFYTKVSSGSALTALVIYSNNSGVPGTLLATSDEVSVSSTTITTVNYTFSGSNQITLTPNTTYFIGMHHSDPGVPTIYEGFNHNTTASNCVYYNFGDTYPGAETTFTVDDSFCFSEFNVDVSYDSPEGVSYPLVDSHLNDSGLRMDFDGVDEYMSKSNPSFGSDTKTNGKTWCEWINLDTTPASETNFNVIIWSQSGTGGVWTFRIRNGRSTVPWTGVRFELQKALDTGAGSGSSTFVYDSTRTLSTGTEYMYCLLTTGTAWQLWVGTGGSISQDTLTVSSGSNNGDWVGDIGFDGTPTVSIGNASVPFDGKRDNLMYFGDDLTSTEMTSLYNGGKPIHPLAVGLTDLSHFWKNGEDANSTISTIHDAVGTDSMTATNMENSDIIPTNYY